MSQARSEMIDLADFIRFAEDIPREVRHEIVMKSYIDLRKKMDDLYGEIAFFESTIKRSRFIKPEDRLKSKVVN